MADPPMARKPPGVLKRAGGLLNSNGQVVKELQDESPASSSNSLGASLKRKFLGFKARSNALARSKSLNGGRRTDDAVTPEEKIRNPFSRSLTDVSIVQASSPPVRQLSSPKVKPKRFSAQPRLQTLPSLEEGTTVNHVTSVPSESGPSSSDIGNIRVPRLLQLGTPMTKVSLKKHKKFVFRLDADLGQIVWESKKHKIIPIENIKEIRSGEDARYYCQQFQLSQDYQDRWLTIIYLLDGNYKTLHLIAATKDVFRMWDRTLRELYAIRQELMQGLGNVEMRQALWEKHYWKGADEERDQKLTFDEVEKLCLRLNINSNNEDLHRLFKQADTQKRGYLDFDDFRQFVKLLKARPDIDRLYKKLRAGNNGFFDFGAFEKFMTVAQKSHLSHSELRIIFDKYSTTGSGVPNDNSKISPTSFKNGPKSKLDSPPVLTLDAFTSFLLSPDNSVFSDQHKDTWQDMTRPLSEYLISSSHNTYLVGHQLVGASTIEGYIRALLHGCRSVEVDIYDGEVEPMIFHGKTFTTKVSLREVCQTIAKYGFVASPYPIIISAEVHCGLPGQDMIAEIMMKEFGESLVRLPVDAEGIILREKIEQLPSPDELKGKILLKAKNFNLLRPRADSDVGYYTDPSSSASDSEALFELLKDGKPSTAPMPIQTDNTEQRRRQSDTSMKDQLAKAGTKLMKRVRSVNKRTSAPPQPKSNPILLEPSDSTTPILSQSPPSMSSLSTSPSSMSILSQSPPSSTSLTLGGLPLIAATSFSPLNVTSGLKSPISLSRRPSDVSERPKPKMSFALLALLVYTVGVRCRGLNKKEEYAPEHMFSLSENTANKMLRFGMWDLIKHTRTHLVRVYPKGTRLSSTNYEPHRFWAAGAQLVAINWQTFDLGYMINHAMFQRNGRSGYVLKPDAIRLGQKERLAQRSTHSFDVTIISAQQLPRPKDASGHEMAEKSIVDPYVEITLYIPDWPVVSTDKEKNGVGSSRPLTPSPAATSANTSTPGRAMASRTSAVKKNGFNPVWEETLHIPFDCVGDMMDLIFVRFVVRQEDRKDTDEPLAVYCAPLGSLQHGYRHLPLHDSQLSQYLYSTLFVRINITNTTPATSL